MNLLFSACSSFNWEVSPVCSSRSSQLYQHSNDAIEVSDKIVILPSLDNCIQAAPLKLIVAYYVFCTYENNYFLININTIAVNQCPHNFLHAFILILK